MCDICVSDPCLTDGTVLPMPNSCSSPFTIPNSCSSPFPTPSSCSSPFPVPNSCICLVPMPAGGECGSGHVRQLWTASPHTAVGREGPGGWGSSCDPPPLAISEDVRVLASMLPVVMASRDQYSASPHVLPPMSHGIHAPPAVPASMHIPFSFCDSILACGAAWDGLLPLPSLLKPGYF